MSLNGMLVVRVDEATEKSLEKLALDNGVTKSGLVRYSLALVLTPRQQPLIYDVIMTLKGKPETSREKYVVKVNANGASEAKT